MVTLHDRIIELGGCSLLNQNVKLINNIMGDTSFLIKAMISPMARGILNILSHAQRSFQGIPNRLSNPKDS